MCVPKSELHIIWLAPDLQECLQLYHYFIDVYGRRIIDSLHTFPQDTLLIYLILQTTHSLSACQYALFIVLRAFQNLWKEGFCLCVTAFMYHFLQFTIMCELSTIQCLFVGFKQIRITRNLVWSKRWMVENLPIPCLKAGRFMWSNIMEWFLM
jgi:hypothetical protein